MEWRSGAFFWFGHSWLLDLGYLGTTLGPLVLLANKKGVHLEAEIHEGVHVEQFKRFWYIGFYFVYAFEHFRNLLRYKSWEMAYYMNKYEIEARDKTNAALGIKPEGVILPLK